MNPVMTERAASAVDAFRAAYGVDPDGVWSAPGRVNLIGEHTDYNDGFVLPLALRQRCVVAAAPTSAGVSRVASVQKPGVVETFEAATVKPGDVTGWVGYVAGVFWALRSAGNAVPDLDLTIDSDVPLGAGLSSSAAVECAVAVALSDLAGLRLDRNALARRAQQAENDFVGAPTGVMDQMAALHGRAGHLVFLDTRTLTVEHVPFPLHEHGLALLVVDTRAPHALVDGAYAERRATCETAARTLGVDALRDLSEEDLDGALARLPDDLGRRRVRHVVTENARVLATVELLRSGADPRGIGTMLTASHESLRHDFEVTVPQLDVAVETALASGAVGARMTGGGFGGCVIALVEDAAVETVARTVAARFADHGFDPPEPFVAVASDGAGRIG